MKAEEYPLEEICRIVRECGEIIGSAERADIRIDPKSGKANFVTDYDRKVQDRLQGRLAQIMPQARFIGEEGSAMRFSPEGTFFIADPIDGTTNFIKDFRASCVSLALVADNVAQIGVVYNPYLDEMFTARRGGGAYCNGRRLEVSSEPLGNALVLFGTSPYNEELARKSFDLAYGYFRRALDVRRSGSAALDLCSVAAGRAELFFELILSPWDFAAGALMVQEAGGTVTDADGNALVYDRPCSVVARNAAVRPLPFPG